MSIPAETPADVITFPSSTNRTSARTWMSWPRLASSSSDAQCVVAALPSSRPASANTSAPVQTLVMSVPRAARPRSHPLIASSPSWATVPWPPG
jgi:hypothetical protein